MAAPRSLVSGPLSEVQPEMVRWLWEGRIPLGKLTVLDGDPGLGKSLVTLDLAARVSRGSPMPGERQGGEPGTALIMTAEDGLADTVRPRLDAMRADVTRVHAVVGAFAEDEAGQAVTFPTDLDALGAKVGALGATLVVVDPFMAYVGGTVNTRIDHDVRRLLAPMARMAEETGAAIVIIRHLNKSADGRALYRGGGSIGLIGAARAGLLIARDPENEDRRVLAVTKMNLAPEPPSLAFDIDSTAGAPTVRWLGESPHRANALVSAPADEDERSASRELRDFIREMVEVTPRTQREAVAAIRQAGFTLAERTIQKARKDAGVVVRRQGFGPGSTVVWALGNGHTRTIDAIPAYPPDNAGMAGMGGYDGSDDGLERLPGRGDAWEPEGDAAS